MGRNAEDSQVEESFKFALDASCINERHLLSTRVIPVNRNNDLRNLPTTISLPSCRLGLTTSVENNVDDVNIIVETMLMMSTSSAAFLRNSPLPSLCNRHFFITKASLTQLPPPPSATISRRAFLALPILGLLLPTRTNARPSKPLSASLTPLINLQSTLTTLSNEIESGTTGDIRRVVKTLLIASDIPNNVRDAAQFLPKSQRESVVGIGRDAYEYLSQVIEYYDPVDVKRRARGDVMAFCLEAVKRADQRLGDVIAAFGEDGDKLRRELNLENAA